MTAYTIIDMLNIVMRFGPNPDLKKLIINLSGNLPERIALEKSNV